ncbi:MAG TPA: ABC transporter permease [Caldilineaceae bacterium]|nr:ABC transporter permease [Caldilineaceae bacterium]
MTTIAAGNEPYVKQARRTNHFVTYLRLLLRDKAALFGLLIIAVVVFTAIAAPWLAPHNPAAQNMASTKLPPAWRTIEEKSLGFGEGNSVVEEVTVTQGDPSYLLGTDKLGRDQLSRIIYGARVSVTVAFFGATLALLIGMTIGLVAGYMGGHVDNLLMAVVNLLLSVPYLVLVIVVAAVLGRGLLNVVLLFGITDAPIFARLTRGEVLRIRRLGYIEAANATGAKAPMILRKHIVPNLIGPLVTLATFEMSSMIFYEAGLSFLGLSVPESVPSWGNMLSNGREFLLTGMPWLMIYPGLAIALTSLGFNLFGDWLRDVLDPMARTR